MGMGMIRVRVRGIYVVRSQSWGCRQGEARDRVMIRVGIIIRVGIRIRVTLIINVRVE